MKASFFTSRRTARSQYKFRSYQGMTKAVTKEKYPQCKQGYLRSDKLSECWIIWAAAVL